MPTVKLEMSSELQIVFIYDTLSCRKEEDDPKEAILYFHPSDVSEDKKIAICGQLMGISHFLMDSFSTPKILTLESVKFSVRKFGKQYVMAMGCSSKTPDWLLDKQADILYSLTKFFHRDIQSILVRAQGDRSLLSTKLTSMMDHYISVSQNHGDLFALTFGILPVLSGSKSANSISERATAILQNCMMKKGVLGGVIMYRNKTVGVELCQDIAQKLAFIQSHQLPPAECVKVNFHMPVGVNLFIVYVSENDMKLIRRRASAFQQPTLVSVMNGVGPISNDHIRGETSSDISSSTGFSEASASSTSSETYTPCFNVRNLELPDCNGNTEEAIDSPELKSSPRHHNNQEMYSEFHRSSSQPLLCDGFERKQKFSCSLPEPGFPGELFGKSHDTYFKSATLGHKSRSEVNILYEKSQPSSNLSSVLPWYKDNVDKDVSVTSNSTSSSIAGENKSSSEGMENGWRFESINPHGTESPSSLLPAFPNGLSTTSSNSTSKSFDNFSGSPPKLRQYGGADIDISSVMHMRMMNSFRKLSSHEDLSSCQSSSENERGGLTTFSKRGNYSNSSNNETNSRIPTTEMCQKPGEEDYERAYLFITSRGSMRLLLMMDADQSMDAETIQSLRDQGLHGLADLEGRISNAEEEFHEGENQSDPYCYLKYEPIWKSLAHSGKSHSMNFDVVQLMHKNFRAYPSISELIIRGDDHVVYGYQCVGSEVYYQQSASLFSGVPVHTDLMGKIPLKAKRRLERDHKIILL